MSEPTPEMWTFVNWQCHLCAEKFNDVFQMRDHWQRDHNYNVRIRITQ